MKRNSSFIGKSQLVTQLRELALQVADTEITVLIIGETGAGKEVLARFIHANSRRADKSFIPVNCGAIPSGILESELFGHEKGAFTGAFQSRKGYFESADRGTIFLDEIGEMPLETQVKFLRVLETGEFQRVGSSDSVFADTRIIAATNKNLYQAVADGNFREDLYYRLRSVELQIPPLRERGPDILLLAEHFIHEFERKHRVIFEGFTPESAELMLRYPWPGNIRELRNLVESLLILEKGKRITTEILEKHLIQRNRYKSLVHEPTKQENQELNIIYRSLIQLRQDINDIRQLLERLIEDRQERPLLLPDTTAHVAPAGNQIVEERASETSSTVSSLDELEKKTIAETLAACEGNKRKTAGILGITERTLYRKIKTYDL
ncbi:sigma-54 interaction domain-containing protein [Chlorobium phaeobacteroides]|uniref:Sigma54 specific transcriptional regulator, Fis family n=1 Tax=Chlorobium phaeobacteroides (strain DSM 266 / SMG 266 / 2430) TaxID=290317 RepID=A1BHM5_CHLPD|nr:sigma-54 dependent transcriptional regulator [Chlorobium phaeobacteroides]ABL65902.1 sigma54 specific transcriptional regulator, Fis family [Chlorobium phaeobacteroides DSM 266]